MDRDEVFRRVAQVIRDVLGRPDVEIGRQTQARDVDGWDSLSNVAVLMQIQQEFGIRFTVSEMRRFECVGDMVDTAMTRLAGS